jgi:heme-degrading monooxygenase HmoA
MSTPHDTIYTATFTFVARALDETFHELDNEIALIVKSIPGYLGEETWESASTGLISTAYYWETFDALKALMSHPKHLAAKEQQARWLKGYHVVIAQVIGCYGDGGIPHPLAPWHSSACGGIE